MWIQIWLVLNAFVPVPLIVDTESYRKSLIALSRLLLLNFPFSVFFYAKLYVLLVFLGLVSDWIYLALIAITLSSFYVLIFFLLLNKLLLPQY
jgi:hypothetical protein